jgi:ribonuclease HII
MPDFAFERAHCRKGPVAGVDEAGRGPLAGPVLAAAVILDPRRIPDGLDDSKRLTAPRREALYAALRETAMLGVGAASVAEITRINILQASLIAMARAVAALKVRPATALIDGNKAPRLDCAAIPIVGGDGLCLSIAAASIVAKVTRDKIMRALGLRWPGYGFERHMGYGTAAHREALSRLGPTPHHRPGFGPVHNILCQDSELTS